MFDILIILNLFESPPRVFLDSHDARSPFLSSLFRAKESIHPESSREVSGNIRLTSLVPFDQATPKLDLHSNHLSLTHLVRALIGANIVTHGVWIYRKCGTGGGQ